MQDPRFWMLVLGILGAIALVSWSVDRWFKAKMQTAGEAQNARQQAEEEQRARDRGELLKSAKIMRAKILWTHQEKHVALCDPEIADIHREKEAMFKDADKLLGE